MSKLIEFSVKFLLHGQNGQKNTLINSSNDLYCIFILLLILKEAEQFKESMQNTNSLKVQ
jgi:hypothetical protein